MTGGIQINGPTSAPYDEDLGTLLLSDWYHQVPDALYDQASTSGPPTAPGGLINGTGVYNTGGTPFETTFVPGKRYRIRLVNTALDHFFRFMIDDHSLTVVSTDFVPIVPYETDTVGLGIGQRYDVIVTAKANQTAGSSFWMRSVPVSGCSKNAAPTDLKGIVRYAASASSTIKSTSTPTSQPPDYDGENCTDEEAGNIVPYMSLNAGGADYKETFQLALAEVGGYEKWHLNNSTFIAEWDSPSEFEPLTPYLLLSSLYLSCCGFLGRFFRKADFPTRLAIQEVMHGRTAFNTTQHVVSLPQANKWTYFVINNTNPIDHPIHLHGHDFWVLAQGTGDFDPSTPLNVHNTPRRDVAMLYGNGHLVIGFVTDNPGTWLLHCHVSLSLLAWPHPHKGIFLFMEGACFANSSFADWLARISRSGPATRRARQ